LGTERRKARWENILPISPSEAVITSKPVSTPSERRLAGARVVGDGDGGRGHDYTAHW
jgi:hypothetical protein